MVKLTVPFNHTNINILMGENESFAQGMPKHALLNLGSVTRHGS